jgi:dienelactone hydrolase
MSHDRHREGRRQFLARCAALMAAENLMSSDSVRAVPPNAQASASKHAQSVAEFKTYQERRRRELWGLLGDLPWEHKPAAPQVIRTEKHENYTLQRLVLDLNGLEPVPALLLIPDRRQPRAPGLLYIHWHGGMYDLGKEQILRGVDVQPPYAPVCADKGIVTLAIDSWCFGERKHDTDGHRGEEDAFKLMLWRGQVLWGLMMFDEFRAFNYLAERPEVDPQRVGAFGMSMGSTKAWWLGALEPRVCTVMDVCCLTDFDALIAAHGLSGHGVYYFVPSLLKHFSTAQINELIVPRPRLSVNGRNDPLTPPAGMEHVRDQLLPLYGYYGRAEDCKIELFECKHEELPEMRREILAWMDRYLLAGADARG